MSHSDETQSDRVAKFREAGLHLLVAEAREAQALREALQKILKLYPYSEAAGVARAALAGKNS